MNSLSKFLSALGVATLVLLLDSCPGASPYGETPYQPDSSGLPEAEGAWEEVLQKDPAYPDNVYLTELIEFHPGKVGDARRVYTPDYYDPDGLPLRNRGALGPPEGSYPATYSNSEATMTVLGSGGWGVWRFDPDYRIVDREGADFITFANHNVLGGDPDGSWNELGRVYVSADGTEWYENGAVHFTVHPDSGTANSGYDWDAVRGLHGNTHAWANFRKEIRAEEIDPATGLYIDAVGTDGSTATVSRYFTPDDPYLGGDRFDLADFVLVGSDPPIKWDSENMKMSYLKIVDDPAILDGQDWNPDWMTGARLMAALGINVEAAGTRP